MSVLRLRALLPVLAAALAAPGVALAGAPGHGATAETVVLLEAPPLASAVQQSRVLSARTKARRLDVHSATSAAYTRALARTQDAVAARIRARIPGATVRWRYRIVLNGLAVSLPAARLPDLSRIPGVRAVVPSTTYRRRLDESPFLIGADQLWGLPDYATAGQGIKIGIIDDGVNQAHPFFDPAGYAYPPGYPKGDVAFTTPKVIAARAFAPASTRWKYARQPFDPELSEHATHVAGIAAGVLTTGAVVGRGPLQGVAPRAFLGNYKALTVPTDQFGLDGNSPELAAAVEAAVADGMDVVNLSLGEPEIEPTRDLLVTALNGAADAGVIPVVAAGNDFDAFGRGSISSPGSTPKAITAAAVSKAGVIAPFSSSGPTPISDSFKPDVSAPGVSILSSVPAHNGMWAQFSGTSMAAPHVAGAAALLRLRHPGWTVAQVKSALVQTAVPAWAEPSRTQEAATTREGGGEINLPRADDPKLFADPTGLSFGLMRPGATVGRTVALTDAGAGAGTWSATVQLQGAVDGVTVAVPASVAVPGELSVVASTGADAAEADVTGFVVLTLGPDSRRIPFWLRVTRPRLGKPVQTIAKAGVYAGDASKGQARVMRYRYPDAPSGSGLPSSYPGPEQVFRITVTGRVENAGVRVVSRARNVVVYPHIVAPGDENRLQGYPALPIDINPYAEQFGEIEPVASLISPAPGSYDVVFDTVARSRAGAFTFRYWVNDTTPPALRLLTRKASRSGAILVSATDAGAGVDPDSIVASVDGRVRDARYDARTGRISIPVGDVPAGRRVLRLAVADYQELKNMENVGPILPNTRTLSVPVTIS